MLLLLLLLPFNSTGSAACSRGEKERGREEKKRERKKRKRGNPRVGASFTLTSLSSHLSFSTLTFNFKILSPLLSSALLPPACPLLCLFP
jgi:hypothetical protein